jgi:hypothetical protein
VSANPGDAVSPQPSWPADNRTGADGPSTDALQFVADDQPALGEQGERGPLARFDPRVAHPARVYSYWLGGKDHYLADREAGDEVARLRPEVVAAARANRAFGQRVTRYAAGLRIRQFLDIGAGLPAPGPTHEIAQKISPACRVVYADNDPLVLAHGRALLTALPGAEPCTYLNGDVRDPAPSWSRPAPWWTTAARLRSCCWPSCTSSPTPTTRPGSSSSWPPR